MRQRSVAGRPRRRAGSAVSVGALMLMLAAAAVMYMLLKFRALGKIAGRRRPGAGGAGVLQSLPRSSFQTLELPGVASADDEDEEPDEDGSEGADGERAGRFVALEMTWPTADEAGGGEGDEAAVEEEGPGGTLWRIEAHMELPGSVARWGQTVECISVCRQHCETDPGCNVFVYCDAESGACGAAERGSCWCVRRFPRAPGRRGPDIEHARGRIAR